MFELQLSIVLMILTIITAQSVVTYNPYSSNNQGEDCLPYDGSVVPDCREYAEPLTKEPYYRAHSHSKFWFRGGRLKFQLNYY